jgi:hypothetical protein
MDQILRDRILASFPNTTYIDTLREYDGGRSGSLVLLVKFIPENKLLPQYGLNGYFIVKIGLEDWCAAERKFYNEQSTTALIDLLARPHMPSQVIEGKIALAYDVAFGSALKPRTLMNILDEGGQSETKVQQQIRVVSQALVKWYCTNDISQNGAADDPLTLIYRMLTPRRADDMVDKMRHYLPIWRPDSLQINIDGLNTRLPNPLAYMQKDTWDKHKIDYRPFFPIARIHGDLHTGNIICHPQAKSPPKVIDFGQSVPDGVPFFDLAYLEFDIIQHVLRIEREDGRRQWLTLLDIIMNTVVPKPSNLFSDVARAWKLILPIRQQVQEMQKVDRENFEIVWWLATIAVGLNFARKGRETRPVHERVAGLLYAAYGLARTLHIFDAEKLSTQGMLFIPWIKGNFSPVSATGSFPPSPPPATPDSGNAQNLELPEKKENVSIRIRYNTAAIRELLTEGLTDSELNALCLDYFHSVHNKISLGMDKQQKIQLLIEYCQRHNEFSRLLEIIKQFNPQKYTEFENSLISA